MIIFLHDDRAYLSWIAHHRQGFVLDGRRKPKLCQLILHRATCQEIKSARPRHSHWTSGRKLKACGMDRAELQEWAVEETGASAAHCPTCEPASEALADGDCKVHLSKLAADILEYIVEAALIHFEVQQPPYRLTVADIAACFAKTPGQISPALHRLLAGGFVVTPGYRPTAAAIPAKRMVLPTIVAMRTLTAYKNESDSSIQKELVKLKPDEATRVAVFDRRGAIHSATRADGAGSSAGCSH
jgi:hypothetical protein